MSQPSPRDSYKTSAATRHEERRPCLRPDLQWSQQDDAWVVKDPVAETFYRLETAEYQVALRFRGRHTLRELLAELQHEHPGSTYNLPWLVAITTRLRKHGLLRPESASDTAGLLQSRNSEAHRRFFETLLSPLAIRIPIWNPDHFLKSWAGPANILFSRITKLTILLLGALSIALVVRQLLRVPFQETLAWNLMRGEHWLLLIICYLVAKSLHELGHGLACVKHQVTCNELGVMLLCFTPCLYCDTTDAWKLPSKWKRAEIAAAGMYIELILAVAAAITWLASSPGAIHQAAAAMMVVCSLGTILVNANPLLRFDGYYIFSDLIGIPNLFQRSREASAEFLRRMFSTMRSEGPDYRGGRFLFLLGYALASTVYRWFVLAFILWLTWTALVPLGLGFLAIGMTALIAIGLVWQYAFRLLSTLKTQWPRKRHPQSESEKSESSYSKQDHPSAMAVRSRSLGHLRYARIALVLLLLAGAVGILALIPVKENVFARAVTHYQNKRALFAPQAATLLEIADPHAQIPKGSLVVRFDAPELQIELQQVNGELQVCRQTLSQLETRKAIDPIAAYQLPVERERADDLFAKQAVLQQELDGLQIRAPFDGWLLGADTFNAELIAGYQEQYFPDQKVVAEKIGAAVKRGQKLGWFIGKGSLEVTAMVPAEDARKLSPGMPCRIRFDHCPATNCVGTVRRISPEPAGLTPSTLVGDAYLYSERNSSGQFSPTKPHYEVTIDAAAAGGGASGALAPATADKPIVGVDAPASVLIQVGATPILERVINFFSTHLRPIY